MNANDPAPDAQRLPLAGHRLECSRHLVLQVDDRRAAGRFLAMLLERDWIAFGADRDTDAQAPRTRVDVAFTWQGLLALGAHERWRADVERCSPAFVEGAERRAARYLGDSGQSAPSTWENDFRAERAHVWLAVHGSKPETVAQCIAELRADRDASALEGWDDARLPPCRVLSGKDDRGETYRLSHFGFRDDIARPKIAGSEADDLHAPGELLVGRANDQGFNLWFGAPLPDDLGGLLLDGSFGVLRQMEQDERGFLDALEAESERLKNEGNAFATVDYLKAKLCGRWPNGALVRPGEVTAPEGPPEARLDKRFSYRDDPDGRGCPFGAHIRRTNPRDGPLTPPRARVLFRRGMSYGPAYTSGTDAPKPDADASRENAASSRGLMGVFVCSSIEDQFERLMSEWVEKTPLATPGAGQLKDPFVGHHDDPEACFVIPQADGAAPIEVKGFGAPFVTTRGTLYGFFPTRRGLERLVRLAGAAPEQDAIASRERSPGQAERSLVGGRRGSRGIDSGTGSTGSTGSGDGRGGSDGSEGSGDTRPDESGRSAADAPADRFCDVVMEGGITSGIIYASAVAELARRYRFKNIGGSSIGAFGAALTAAAEFRRRHGSAAGFEAVAELPERLAATDGTGRTMLERLFVPQPETARLFAVFLATLNQGSGAARAWAAFREALHRYRACGLVALALSLLVWIGPLAGVLTTLRADPSPGDALAVLLGWWLSWLLPWVVTLLVLLLVAIPARAVHDLVRGVVPNGFGLCRGWQKGLNPAVDIDLAGYLHRSIQAVAYEDPLAHAPLTFGDLWRAPGSPSAVFGSPTAAADARSINLEVYSSNLAHNRPYRFPLDLKVDDARLYFRVEDLEDYFPEAVVQHLRGVGVPYAASRASDPPEGPDTAGFLELPVDDLPIVVAVRLAMSFPGLIAAVPLWAIDRESPDRANRRLERCWMSDGGLCSNFPIHLFDSLVPRWPTFGISLQNRGDVRPRERLWLPQHHRDGRDETWDRGLQRARTPLARVGGFLIALWNTTWHWNDSTMMRMPGVRDRVVRLFLEPGEGGINIRMGADQIRGLAANYGQPAAQAFIDKFADGPGWDEHRWVRFHTALISIGARVSGLKLAAGLDRHAVPLRQQIAESVEDAPLRGDGPLPRASERPLPPDAAERLQALLTALEALEGAFAAGAGGEATYEALPQPSLRIRHPT